MVDTFNQKFLDIVVQCSTGRVSLNGSKCFGQELFVYDTVEEWLKR
jgi:hypothetical protein